MPGMTANVQFLVAEKNDVLAIPNIALRFRLPEENTEAQTLLRRERSRTAPRVGQRRTSRRGGSGTGGGEENRVRQVKVHVLKDGRAQPVEIQVGISDGSRTEVVGGLLALNDPVIIGMSSSATGQGQSGVANPFQPARPSRTFGFR